MNNNNNIINNNNIKNTSKENDRNSKIKSNYTMKGMRNSKNVVYQVIILPKENIKKTTYIGISSTENKV